MNENRLWNLILKYIVKQKQQLVLFYTNCRHGFSLLGPPTPHLVPMCTNWIWKLSRHTTPVLNGILSGTNCVPPPAYNMKLSKTETDDEIDHKNSLKWKLKRNSTVLLLLLLIGHFLRCFRYWLYVLIIFCCLRKILMEISHFLINTPLL